MSFSSTLPHSLPPFPITGGTVLVLAPEDDTADGAILVRQEDEATRALLDGALHEEGAIPDPHAGARRDAAAIPDLQGGALLGGGVTRDLLAGVLQKGV